MEPNRASSRSSDRAAFGRMEKESGWRAMEWIGIKESIGVFSKEWSLTNGMEESNGMDGK